MVMIEYGKERPVTVILLHGGGLSWWNYREVANLLRSHCHVVLPILDGHAGSDQNFISIAQTASNLIDMIDTVYNGSVALIGGVSLGGQILLEMLAQRPDICQFALIESARVLPTKLTHLLLKPMLAVSYGLIRQKWFSKLQFCSLRIPSRLFACYYTDTCRITKENMFSFLYASCRYRSKPELAQVRAKPFLFIGQNEQTCMHRSAHRLQLLLPDADCTVMPNRYHGEFSLRYAEEYAHKVLTILEHHKSAF